ncbi:hypothetical protein E2P63_03240, partial [Candidatus Bathyarchaeota archaeon]
MKAIKNYFRKPLKATIFVAFAIVILIAVMLLLRIPLSDTVPTVAISATTSTNIYIGGSVSFMATVTGGTPPYTIMWYPLSGSDTPVSILFSNSGSYNVYAVVVDATGQTSPISNQIQVSVSVSAQMSKRAILLKEKTQGNTVQPHDWNAIADVYHAYGINMAIVEIA